MIEEAADTRKFAFAVHDELLLFRIQFGPGDVQRNLDLLGKALQLREEWTILRLRPRLDGTIIQGLRLVWNHQIEVEVDGVAESLAARTGAVGIVEGEQDRLGLFVADVIPLAFEALAEAQLLGCFAFARDRKSTRLNSSHVK